MSKHEVRQPIIKRILDKFDPRAGESFVHHTEVYSPVIISTKTGYKMTVYDRQALVISAKAEGGIFGQEGPSRVEFSREESGGMMSLFVREENPSERGLVFGEITDNSQPKREALVLPGDDGFELFEELHTGLQTIKPLLADAVGLLGQTVSPEEAEQFSYKDRGGDYLIDTKTGIASTSGETLIELELTDSYGLEKDLAINLDARREYATPTAALYYFKYPEPAIYRAGEVKITYRTGNIKIDEEQASLDIESLLAFGDIHRTIRNLHRE